MSTPTDADSLDKWVKNPTPSRTYDWLLNGGMHFAKDRSLGAQLIELLPDLPATAQANRQWLGRVIPQMIRLGVRQFVDIGGGLPDQGCAASIAHQACPAARVVVVDNDPIVCAAWAGYESIRTRVVCADLRRPGELWEALARTWVLDPQRPIGVVAAAVAHFLPFEAAQYSLGWIRRNLPTYSLLAFSHAFGEPGDAASEQAAELYGRIATTRVYPRTRDEIADLLSGWCLTGEGLVPAHLWGARSGDVGPESARVLAALAWSERVAFI
jgi:hypothetical protein